MTAITTTFNGKNIIIGVTGGIAAYKSADLCRRLQQAGAEVRIVMTLAATDFVTALTFQALSGHDVFVGAAEGGEQTAGGDGMLHIELARWADIIVIAPASANSIAKLAVGRADNILTTLCLASEADKFFAPAMNRVMWQDVSTQNNCKILRAKNWRQLGPVSGLQACGETGEGRMLDVPDIFSQLEEMLSGGELQGLNIVITAGPTYEAIDPVRFIGNRSSGRMGYALAAAAQSAGASVCLISGPCHLPVPDKISFTAVESAQEMQQAVMRNIQSCHIYISAAAISDYRVASVAARKIKKTEDNISLSLVKNEDILCAVADLAQRPYVVGFAAETENIIENAKDKLLRKNLDMIAANDVSEKNHGDEKQPVIGFNSEYNALHVFWLPEHKDKSRINEQYFDIARKSRLAQKLVSLIAQNYKIIHDLNEKNTA